MKKNLKIIGGFLFFLLLVVGIGFITHFYFPSKHQPQFPTYENWDNGTINHILPAADHRQFLIKISLSETLKIPPKLQISDTTITKISTEGKGRFWQFHIKGLSPNTVYNLTLQKANGETLADSWTLKTFPHPDSVVQKMTILAYTCAGGVEDRVLNQELFIKTKYKHALLKKGLTFNPDIVIANGDHIYWDRKSMNLSKMRQLVEIRLSNIYGKLDLTKPMLSVANYETFTRICDAQIAELYGCLLRSTPVYFLSDDHDLFENDEGTPKLVTLPPKPYMLDGATSTQQLYYPEFLEERNRPDLLDRHSYGVFRYGKLVEGLLYDAKRHTTLKGKNAQLVETAAENWIIKRTKANDTKHLFHIPSSPVGWTAGKWAEWYPDVMQVDGSIGIGEKQKYMWQTGWWSQHQRLLKALGNQTRQPIVLQGDLHILSYGLIKQSGNLNFEENPIHVIGTGPLGSGDFGFPSRFRGTPSVVPDSMKVEEILSPLEKNGFTIIEITPQSVQFSLYSWRPDEGIESIEQLEPILVKEIK